MEALELQADEVHLETTDDGRAVGMARFKSGYLRSGSNLPEREVGADLVLIFEDPEQARRFKIGQKISVAIDFEP